MVGEMTNSGRIRQAFPGTKDLTSTSTEGTEYGPVEFTREAVDALLHERIKYKSKYNYNERCENTMDYVKRLRLCIRWFQELELDYAFQQDKLKNAMELNEKHCADLDVSLKEKEVELILVIHGRTFPLFRCNLPRTSREIEKEAIIPVEKLEAALTEELGKTQGDLQTAN